MQILAQQPVITAQNYEDTCRISITITNDELKTLSCPYCHSSLTRFGYYYVTGRDKAIDEFVNCFIPTCYYEIRIFAQRINEVARLLRFIEEGAERIKEIEKKMNITYVSDKNYNQLM